MARTLLGCAMTTLAAVVLLTTPVAAYNNGAGARPAMGWNTWCTFDVCGLIDKCSDAEIRLEAAAMVSSGMAALGYEYINMDDCWNAKTRDAKGNLQPDAARFPHGMKALVDYVHSLGLKVGLYTSIGTRTCKNDLPGSFGNYERDAKTFAGWGIDFVKCDNCAKPGQYTEYQLFSNFSAALNATNRSIYFSLCEWGDQDVQTWGAQVAQSYRIQMDHLPLYNFPLRTAAGKGFGQGVKNIIDYVATLKPSTFVKQYGWMDPDFLMTLFWPTMTYRYSKVEISMWSMWSAPLVVDTQISNMTAEKLELLTNPEVIAIDQDPSWTAADMVGNNTETAVMLWARPLHNGDAAIVILNQNDYRWGAAAVNVTVDWREFGLTSPPTKVRDVWARAYLKPSQYSNTSYNTMLNATDIRMFRVSCAVPPCIARE